MAYVYTVTLRDGQMYDFVSTRSLSEQVLARHFDEQFVLFIDRLGGEHLLPSDDIAYIQSEDDIESHEEERSCA
jgi:hypothetical protein